MMTLKAERAVPYVREFLNLRTDTIENELETAAHLYREWFKFMVETERTSRIVSRGQFDEALHSILGLHRVRLEPAGRGSGYKNMGGRRWAAIDVKLKECRC